MKILDTILGLPEKAEGAMKASMFSDMLSNFNSNDGVRSHISCIYNYASFIFLILFLYGTAESAMDYIGNAEGGMAKVGSILSMLVFVYAGFLLARVIRSAGKSFEGGHDGVLSLVFKDFVMINIRMVGEFMAVLAFFGAVTMTLAWLLNTGVYTSGGSNFLGAVMPVFEFPMMILAQLLDGTPLEVIGGAFNSLNNLDMGGSMSQMGDNYSMSSLTAVVMSYIGVIVLLIQMYASLAVYGYLYGLVETLIKWISAPSLPIKMK